MRSISALTGWLLLSLLSCQPTEQPTPAEYNVPAEIEPYIQAFRDESAKRRQVIYTSNLVVTFGVTQGNDVCGECRLQSGQTPKVVINPDEFCWQKASANERECLIFHELGHCWLKRAHQTARFPNKAYVSLMNPDDVTVYATCHYPIDDNCDKRPRRSYYVDELFDPTTPAPIWSN